MSESYTFSTADELDLEGEGFQPQTGEFVVTKAEIVEHENGQRWQLTFEPVDASAIVGLPGGKVKDSGYLSHKDPDSQANRIGRSILKRIGKTITGSAKFQLGELEGKTVVATVREDDAGFVRISRYNAA